jgi:hypothetical protein
MTRTLSVAALSLFLAIGASAQDNDLPPVPDSNAAWQLLVFPAGDNTATQTVNDYISAGFLPVGMEIEAGDSLSILLVQAGVIEVESWAIIDYDDWNALEAEITGGIQDGFVPMDISRFGEALAVLWVRADIPIDGWRISTSSVDATERTRTVNEFQGQGFTLWGVSEHDGLMWYLFLRQPGAPPAGAISRFSREAGAIQEGIVAANENGWVPAAYAAGNTATYVGFIR